jgi:small neutral amino acid transporter SnatA (MarC family)
MVEGCEQPTALQSHLVQFAASLLAMLNPLAEVAIVVRLANGRSRGQQPGIAIQPSVAIAVITALLVSSTWHRSGANPPNPTLRPTHV